MKSEFKLIAIGLIGIAIIFAVIQISNEMNFENSNIEDSEINSMTKEMNLEIQEKINEIEEERKNYEGLFSDYNPSRDRQWPTSGPFQIDRFDYYLGEKIFINAINLNPNDKGSILIVKPSNETHFKTHFSISFDGKLKNGFNVYVEPKLNGDKNICSHDELLGEWNVIFYGTNYPTIVFEMLNKTVPGDEWKYYEPVC